MVTKKRTRTARGVRALLILVYPQAGERCAIAEFDSRVTFPATIALTSDSAAKVKAPREISMSRTAISRNVPWLMRFNAMHYSHTITTYAAERVYRVRTAIPTTISTTPTTCIKVAG